MKKILKLITASLLCLMSFSCRHALADVNTPHYSLVEPTNGGSTSTWGPKLNSNFASLDGLIWSASQGTTIGVNAPASSATSITLTNPVNNIQNISFSATAQKLILAPMNVTSSVVVGGTLTINNVGSDAFGVYAQDGTTVIVSSLAAGQTVYVTLTSGATANGTFTTSGPYLTAVGSLNLGTSASATNPQRSAQAGTGFYTAGSNLVDVAVNSTLVDEWSSTGQVTSGTDTANAFIPVGTSVPANGLYLPTANTPTIAANSNPVAQFISTGTANQITFSNSATTLPPAIGAVGSDTNIGVSILSKGTGLIGFGNSSGYQAYISTSTGAPVVDQVTIAGSVTGSPATVTVSAGGTDSNVNLNLVSKGTGNVLVNGVGISGSALLSTNGYQQFPSGLVIEWGSDSNTGNPRTVNFPLTFPHNCFSVVANSTSSNAGIQETSGYTTSSFTLTQGNFVGSMTWIAIGN